MSENKATAENADEQAQFDFLFRSFRKNNFLAYCKYYFPHLFPLKFSKRIHADWGDSIERARFESLFEGYLAPRDTAKTTFFSIVAPIYWLSHDRDEKIHIVQKTGDVSSVIRQIVYELEHNERLIADFGAFKPSDRNLKWSYEEGGIVEGAKDKKNLSISGCGVRGANIGKRTTKVVIDDPHDPENVYTLFQRDKTIAWIMEAIMPTLTPRGSFFAVNSSYHSDDFLNRYKKKEISLTWTTPEGAVLTKEFKIRTYDSIVDESTRETIWPEKNSYERLMFLKKIMGSEAFNRQYRNIVQTDETASFKLDVLELLVDSTLSYTKSIRDRARYSSVIQVYDLAVVDDKAMSEEKDSDYYVCFTIGVRASDKRRELIDVWHERGVNATEVLAKIAENYAAFAPDLVIVESNQFQRWLADFLLRFKNMPIYKSVTVGKDRAELELKSSVLHVAIENRLWLFPYQTESDRRQTDDIFHELNYFGKERHDDYVMALYIFEKVLGNVQRIIAESLIEQSGDSAFDINDLDELKVNL